MRTNMPFYGSKGLCKTWEPWEEVSRWQFGSTTKERQSGVLTPEVTKHSTQLSGGMVKSMILGPSMGIARVWHLLSTPKVKSLDNHLIARPKPHERFCGTRDQSSI